VSGPADYEAEDTIIREFNLRIINASLVHLK